MKKIITLLLALAVSTATPFLLHADKTKTDQNYTDATVRYEELSTALKTNKILQGILARDIIKEIKEQDVSSKKKHLRQLENILNNEQLLNTEIKELLHKYPKLKKGE